MYGNGYAPLSRAYIRTVDLKTDIELPVGTPLTRGSDVFVSGTVSGQWLVPPGAQVEAWVERDAPDAGNDFYSEFYLSGYLTPKP